MSICQDRLGFFQKELFSAYNDTKGNLQMFATPVDFNWYSSVEVIMDIGFIQFQEQISFIMVWISERRREQK